MHSVSQPLREFKLLFLEGIYLLLTGGVVFRNLPCFLQDFLGGCSLGSDREFRPERQTASNPGQPSVPPIRPHTGTPSPTPNPHHLQLSISGLSFPLGCLLHSPAFCFRSSGHRPTLTGRLFVPQLTLNPFSLTILLLFHSDPHFSSFSPFPFFLPYPCSLSVFSLSSLLLPRFPS